MSLVIYPIGVNNNGSSDTLTEQGDIELSSAKKVLDHYLNGDTALVLTDDLILSLFVGLFLSSSHESEILAFFPLFTGSTDAATCLKDRLIREVAGGACDIVVVAQVDKIDGYISSLKEVLTEGADISDEILSRGP